MNGLAIMCVLGILATPGAAGSTFVQPPSALDPSNPSGGQTPAIVGDPQTSTIVGTSNSPESVSIRKADSPNGGQLGFSPASAAAETVLGWSPGVGPWGTGPVAQQSSRQGSSPALSPAAPEPPTLAPSTSTSRNLPQCPSHDPTAYHGLVDEERGCHYDHTHNASPYASALWELYLEVVGPQEISYAWQTPHENLNKHEAYKYAVWPSHIAAPGTCVQDLHGEGTPAGAQFCIVDFLLQFHASPAFGMGTRFHSFAGCFSLMTGVDHGEGEACFGGWSDYLKSMIPYQDPTGDLVNLAPFDPVLPEDNYRLGVPPYIAARPFSYCSQSSRTVERDLAGHGIIRHQWNSGSDRGGSEDQEGVYGSRVEFDFSGLDAWGGVCPQDPSQIIRVDNCPHCNNSQARIYELVVHIPDLNGDGSRVRFRGYTNLLGNIDRTCRETGPECASAYIDAMPGRYTFRIPIDSTVSMEEFFQFYDYDVYFDGEPSGWIEFPN